MFSLSINGICLTFSKNFIDYFDLGNKIRLYVIIRMIHKTNKIPKQAFLIFNINIISILTNRTK